MKSFLQILVLLLCSNLLLAQQTINGIIIDSLSNEPIPFSFIKKGDKIIAICNIEGQFILPEINFDQEYSAAYLGYQPQKFKLIDGNNVIRLKPAINLLGEVVVKPNNNEVDRVLKEVWEHKSINDPDKYAFYSCNIYYKLITDARLRNGAVDSSIAIAKDAYLLFGETYSKRIWKKPANLQELVIASRMSGFKNLFTTGVVTDLIPFHAYSSFLTFNKKDFLNPIAPNSASRYSFELVDKIMKGNDTVWLIKFTPKKDKQELSGIVCINSNGFAIENITAKFENASLNQNIKFEQQYLNKNGKWFPDKLIYNLDYQIQRNDTQNVQLHLSGTSQIDSISFQQYNYHFDKAHTIKLLPDALTKDDAFWNAARAESLSVKEAGTYSGMDSVVRSTGMGKIFSGLEKLPELKVPLGCVDVNLNRLFAYNRFEGTRLGLGLQSNEKLMKWLSVGAWAGYGFKDKDWKYGSFVETYLDKYKDGTIRFEYDNDIYEPGRTNIADGKVNYLRRYLLKRVDKIEAYTLKASERLGYWRFAFSLSMQKINPEYNYIFSDGLHSYNAFSAREGQLAIRYAYGEKRAPIFNTYASNTTTYPVLNINITAGEIYKGSYNADYVKAIASIKWHIHLNGVGKEYFLIAGGKFWSSASIPLSKLFAGNGIAFGSDLSAYSSGNMITMYPYEYYMDKFINVYWEHEFDWTLYRSKLSAPFFALNYNMLYGKLDNPTSHQNVSFLVPDNGYNEVGIQLKDILLVKYLNVANIAFSAGYFIPFNFNMQKLDKDLVAIGLAIRL